MIQRLDSIQLPDHGGDLVWASDTFHRPIHEWVDLSTGISPWAYPVPNVPPETWQPLPYQQQPLLDAAAHYYQCPYTHVLPVAGSQCAIDAIPQTLKKSCVAIPLTGYQEHAKSWEKSGHQVIHYDDPEQLQCLLAQKKIHHIVIINPNNPTAEYWSMSALLALHSQLSSQQKLIVDEAFMDLDEQHSLRSYIGRDTAFDNIIVLRSVGKFFGVAGVRLGFVLSASSYLSLLQQVIPLWQVSNIALWLGEKILLDDEWQQLQCKRIYQRQQKMCVVLSTIFKHYSLQQAGLFTTLIGDQAEVYSQFMTAAEAGVLLRYGDCKIANAYGTEESHQEARRAWLRIGLPKDEHYSRVEEFFGR